MNNAKKDRADSHLDSVSRFGGVCDFVSAVDVVDRANSQNALASLQIDKGLRKVVMFESSNTVNRGISQHASEKQVNDTTFNKQSNLDGVVVVELE